MRQHTFRARIELQPRTGEGGALGFPDGTRTWCVVQPCPNRYFPASILRWQPTSPAVVDVVVSIPLDTGEAEAHFGVAQRFTVWADAIVADTTTRAEGLIGRGVICAQPPATVPATPAPGPARAERPLCATAAVPGPRLRARA